MGQSISCNDSLATRRRSHFCVGPSCSYGRLDRVVGAGEEGGEEGGKEGGEGGEEEEGEAVLPDATDTKVRLSCWFSAAVALSRTHPR